MNEKLKWGTFEFQAGDLMQIAFDHRLATIVDIYKSDDTFDTIFVQLEIGANASAIVDGPEVAYRLDNKSLLLPADEFAYRVDHGHFKPISKPLYHAGQTFIHHLNNDTIEVISVSEQPDKRKQYSYFVRLVNEFSDISYTTVGEEYLENCIRAANVLPDALALPVIPVDAQFPSADFISE